MIRAKTVYNLFLFRKDLRIKDNPALLQAFKADLPLILLYVFDHKVLTLGTNSAVFNFNVVTQLSKDLSNHLFIREGNTEDVLNTLIEQYKVNHIFVNDNTEPALTDSLNFKNVDLKDKLSIVNDRVLDLDIIDQGRHKPYVKFTYFYQRILKTQAFVPPLEYDLNLEELLPQLVKPKLGEQAAVQPPKSLVDIDSLYPNTNEQAVAAQLSDWYEFLLPKYGSHPKNLNEDKPSYTSHLIAIGLLSKRKLIELNSKERALAVNSLSHDSTQNKRIAGCDRLLRNVIWNEFCRYMHQHHPDMDRVCIACNPTLVFNKEKFLAWCQANTGCPIVDIAINQLIGTGHLPNALRLLVASYLINVYKLPWQYGAQFFKEHLIDADNAANSFNWQFVAKTLPSNSLRSITRFDNKLKVLDPQNRLGQLAHTLAKDPAIKKYKRELAKQL
jgi:deoxyribodipyrimidine photo-lyase